MVVPGGAWQMTVSDRAGGGSRVDVVLDRKSFGLRGRFFHAILQVAGPIILSRSLKRMLAAIP